MNKKLVLTSLRLSYSQNELLEKNVSQNPYLQFTKWFEEVLTAQVVEPNAMHLSTISDGKPHGRIVLLKGFDEHGFVFFTNYKSNKGKELEKNIFVSLTFFWGDLERQVRVEGEIEKISSQDSDEYYHSRPRGSQIGAWVSNQSQVIDGRKPLEDRLLSFEKQFKTTAIIPRPPYWGGYRVIPDTIEFWQGRPNRLHDRILYSKQKNDWKIERLSP